MAVVHDNVPVIPNEVFDGTFSLEALNDRHINHTCSLVFSSAELSDALAGQSQEGRQSFVPLVHQLTTVHENERVDGSLPDYAPTTVFPNAVGALSTPWS